MLEVELEGLKQERNQQEAEQRALEQKEQEVIIQAVLTADSMCKIGRRGRGYGRPVA
jgi:hypothetical protein